jgi:hypothetical protein
MSAYSSYKTVGSILGAWTLVSLALGVFSIVCCWKIFEKLDVPGWACLIPFYNTYKLFEAVYGNGWKMLLLLIPFANIVFVIKLQIDLAHELGRSTAFGVGMLLIPIVFYGIAAFSDGDDYDAGSDDDDED